MKNTIYAYGGTLFLGALLPLAFAPFNLYLLSIVIPSLLLAFLQTPSPRVAFFRGWCFGFGVFLVGASWVFVSIHRYGHSNIVLALLLTLLFTAFLGLYYALQCYVLCKLFKKPSWQKNVLGFPIIWLIFEILRCKVLTGFPWLLLGYSQTNAPFAAFAPIIGVYGVSLLLVFMSSLLFMAWRGRWCVTLIIFIVIFSLAGYLKDKSWTTTVKKPLTVSLIQGNIPQELKWQQSALNGILKTYVDLSKQHFNSRLIVWPEGAIPLPTPYSQPFIDPMAALAKQHQSTILSGVLTQSATNGRYYNSVLAFGMDKGRYDKRHLVPFGEYVPLQSLLRGLINFFNLPMSDLNSGQAGQPLIKVGDDQLAPFICYEIAYPSLIPANMAKADAIVYISDDSWFGDSIASAQQTQFAQMRALETGRYVIAATNNGITAIINDKGHLIKQLPRFNRAVLNGQVPARQGFTPYLHMVKWLAIG